MELREVFKKLYRSNTAIACAINDLASSSTNPVEISNFGDIPMGIEASLSPLGYKRNENTDEIEGKVFLIKVVDESTGVHSYENILVTLDGTITQPYTGDFEALEDGSKTVAPQKYQWTNGSGEVEVVTAYAKLDSNGNFVEWVVTEGNPPLDLTLPEALTSHTYNTTECEYFVGEDAPLITTQFAQLTSPGGYVYPEGHSLTLTRTLLSGSSSFVNSGYDQGEERQQVNYSQPTSTARHLYTLSSQSDFKIWIIGRPLYQSYVEVVFSQYPSEILDAKFGVDYVYLGSNKFKLLKYNSNAQFLFKDVNSVTVDLSTKVTFPVGGYLQANPTEFTTSNIVVAPFMKAAPTIVEYDGINVHDACLKNKVEKLTNSVKDLIEFEEATTPTSNVCSIERVGSRFSPRHNADSLNLGSGETEFNMEVNVNHDFENSGAVVRDYASMDLYLNGTFGDPYFDYFEDFGDLNGYDSSGKEGVSYRVVRLTFTTPQSLDLYLTGLHDTDPDNQVFAAFSVEPTSTGGVSNFTDDQYASNLLYPNHIDKQGRFTFTNVTSLDIIVVNNYIDSTTVRLRYELHNVSYLEGVRAKYVHDPCAEEKLGAISDKLTDLLIAQNTTTSEILALQTVNTGMSSLLTNLVAGQTLNGDKLDFIRDAVNNLENTNTNLFDTLFDYVDGLEAGQVVTQDLITDLTAFVDEVEGQLTTLITELDEVEESLKKRDVVPTCYQWDNGGVIEKVTGYARLDEDGAFSNWVVLSGNAPADLTLTDALVPCESPTLELEDITYCDYSFQAAIGSIGNFQEIYINGFPATADHAEYDLVARLNELPNVSNASVTPISATTYEISFTAPDNSIVGYGSSLSSLTYPPLTKTNCNTTESRLKVNSLLELPEELTVCRDFYTTTFVFGNFGDINPSSRIEIKAYSGGNANLTVVEQDTLIEDRYEFLDFLKSVFGAENVSGIEQSTGLMGVDIKYRYELNSITLFRLDGMTNNGTVSLSEGFEVVASGSLKTTEKFLKVLEPVNEPQPRVVNTTSMEDIDKYVYRFNGGSSNLVESKAAILEITNSEGGICLYHLPQPVTSASVTCALENAFGRDQIEITDTPDDGSFVYEVISEEELSSILIKTEDLGSTVGGSGVTLLQSYSVRRERSRPVQTVAGVVTTVANNTPLHLDSTKHVLGDPVSQPVISFPGTWIKTLSAAMYSATGSAELELTYQEYGQNPNETIETFTINAYRRGISLGSADRRLLVTEAKFINASSDFEGDIIIER